MKKIIKCTVPIFLAGLLLSEVSFASHPDTRAITEECTHVAHQLNDMAGSNPEDRCAGDLEIAAAYIEAAGFKLRYQKTQQALTSIKYGELELKEISMNRAYCSQVFQSVKPVIARVIRLASEIEVLERLNRTAKPG